MHGDSDGLISHYRCRLLYETLLGEKKFIIVPAGNHYNVLVTETPVNSEMAKLSMKSSEQNT